MSGTLDRRISRIEQARQEALHRWWAERAAQASGRNVADILKDLRRLRAIRSRLCLLHEHSPTGDALQALAPCVRALAKHEGVSVEAAIEEARTLLAERDAAIAAGTYLPWRRA